VRRLLWGSSLVSGLFEVRDVVRLSRSGIARRRFGGCSSFRYGRCTGTGIEFERMSVLVLTYVDIAVSESMHDGRVVSVCQFTHMLRVAVLTSKPSAVASAICNVRALYQTDLEHLTC